MRGILKGRLESVSQANWADTLDHQSIIAGFSEHLLNTPLPKMKQEKIPTRQTRISVSKIETLKDSLELWFEYVLKKDNGVVIGTIVTHLDINGDLSIEETHGTHLVPKD